MEGGLFKKSQLRYTVRAICALSITATAEGPELDKSILTDQRRQRERERERHTSRINAFVKRQTGLIMSLLTLQPLICLLLKMPQRRPMNGQFSAGS